MDEPLVAEKRGTWWSRRTMLEKVLIPIFVIMFGCSVGYIIGLLMVEQTRVGRDPHFQPLTANLKRQQFIQQKIANEFTPANIKQNLRDITKNVHVAGTKNQLNVLQYLFNRYASFGMDSVQFLEYNVALNYPNYSNPNKVWMQQGSSWTQISNGLSNFLGPKEAQTEEKRDPRGRNLWNAYAKDGTTVPAPIVYAHYGTVSDFAYLHQIGINVNGSIALIRYGHIFRGDKAYNAQKAGAIGVIMYMDPADYGPPAGQSPTDVFPNSVWMPPSGAQRGSVYKSHGDYMTPFYPSKNYTFRSISTQQAQQSLLIPNVPVLPMGYRDAVKIFKALNGQAVNASSWSGGFNLTYRYTGSALFKVEVHSTQTSRSPIKNVMAIIRGQEEPDRWVIFNNHVDAWTFGAQDPNSGTAVIIEMARVFMAVHNATGWRPRRTLVFLSVDAEEFGLIGSTEFTEEYLKLLQARAVALLNVDVAVHGNTSFDASAVPMLYRTIVNAAKITPNPNPVEKKLGRSTVYQTWDYYMNPGNISAPFLPPSAGVPYMSIPSSGSDQASFNDFIGIPSAYTSYRCRPRSCYALYHTQYELDWTMENLVDKNFLTSNAVGQMWAETGRALSDSLLIPFNVTDLAVMLNIYVSDLNTFLKNNQFQQLINGYDSVLKHFIDVIGRFTAAATNIQGYIDSANSANTQLNIRQIEMINSRLTNLERAFIDPRGLPGRPIYRHVIFATSAHNAYGGVTFAGVRDSVANYQAAQAKNDANSMAHWLKEVQISLTAIQYSIESAILVLNLDGFS